MAWHTEGLLTDPALGAVLADTGRFTQGRIIYPCLILASSVGFQALLQRRNTSNDATVSDNLLPVTLSIVIVPSFGPIHIKPGERLRIVTRAAVVGDVQCSIFHD